MGIARSTARTHLLHVFEKTGCRRQAELIALAARLSRPG
jgi:DNA-binding CsgD family transcriptional regulator